MISSVIIDLFVCLLVECLKDKFSLGQFIIIIYCFLFFILEDWFEKSYAALLLIFNSLFENVDGWTAASQAVL